MLEAWNKCNDAFMGSDTVKSKRDTYLPPTSGMRQDGFGKGDTAGEQSYQAYLTRAYFPDVFAEAVETAIGVMHRKPAIINVTPKLEVMLERASSTGEDLQMLLRRINALQLRSGRLALLGDIEVGTDNLPRPTIKIYSERSAYNWDECKLASGEGLSLRFVALDESGYELQTNFEWEHKDRTRLLALINPETKQLAVKDENGEIPSNAVYGYAELEDNDDFAKAQYDIVNAQGTTLDQIPLVFINSKDLNPSPDKPPLEGLADLMFTIYRGEADYRQHIFEQSQDTLVRIGANGDEEEVRIGSGALIDVPINGDAKFIGVNSQGLTEQRTALENDYKKAEAKSSKLMSQAGEGAESGEALRIRVAAQTATLPQIAEAGAQGLTTVLKQLAVLLGDNPDDIIVTPNKEFTDTSGNAQTLTGIVTAKFQGAPISDESIHAWMVENKFTSKTYEEEIALINAEEPRV
tara:strand:- start:52707 stop:54101 length:1395 start_codon:yes stop_codon:yes gene_type:complete